MPARLPLTWFKTASVTSSRTPRRCRPVATECGALLHARMSAATSCGHVPSSESDVKGHKQPPALQKRSRENSSLDSAARRRGR